MLTFSVTLHKPIICHVGLLQTMCIEVQTERTQMQTMYILSRNCVSMVTQALVALLAQQCKDRKVLSFA
jgi:hypothetical protein